MLSEKASYCFRMISIPLDQVSPLYGSGIVEADQAARRSINFSILQDVVTVTGQPLITCVIESKKLQWAGHALRAPEKRGIHKALYGRVVGRRPQGRPRIRWVENVREEGHILGGQGLGGFGQGSQSVWKALVEAVVGLQTL